jgi:hypothetical protein
MQTRYWDANIAAYRTIEYTEMQSQAGWTGEVDYRVTYHLANGLWLTGMRHRDRGDLMTAVKITKHRPRKAWWRA